MSVTNLLDANALIALVISDHDHHNTAARRVAEVDEIALCHIA